MKTPTKTTMMIAGGALALTLVGGAASAQPYGYGDSYGYGYNSYGGYARDSDRDGVPDRREWNRDRDRDGRPDQWDRYDNRRDGRHHGWRNGRHDRRAWSSYRSRDYGSGYYATPRYSYRYDNRYGY